MKRAYLPYLIVVVIVVAALAIARFPSTNTGAGPRDGNSEQTQAADAGPAEMRGVSGPDNASGGAETPHESELPEISEQELAELPPDGGAQYNRLIFEQSPYLLIHATNPVDWYPWGDEAFEKAREEDKPIILSVGYSTCHWCHVMERESFSDEEVAELMNANFVAVKVDREERPDIDSIYMDVTQAMTGRGGWPNTVFLTPDRDPFFAGTYFPKEQKFNRPGLMDLLPRIAEAWDTRRDELVASAREATAAIGQNAVTQPGATPDESTLAKGFRELKARFDPEYGGFASEPKFPSPHNFYFLLRHARRTGDPEALDMVETTLRAMRRGGIFDHVGFGFHRYSTDREWLLPHFEKMLYDQALIAYAYIETFQATGDSFYGDTAREIFTYVLRDMTSPEHGFYSAENADSEGEEGLFYFWTDEELRHVLGDEKAELFIRVFNVKRNGNFREEASGRRTGHNILYLAEPISEIAEDLDMPPSELSEQIESGRQTLFAEREKRVHPLKDDKVLTDWNGLMIAALAKGGRALNETEYIQAAERAATFLLEELRRPDGRLLHRYRNGDAGLPASLEDYAYLVWGLIELYESTFNTDYLVAAQELTDTQMDLFWDEQNGGFFKTSHDSEKLIFRPKDVYDGARPSGNSVASLNLLRLGRITANSDWERKAEETMTAFGQQIRQAPGSHTHMLAALDFGIGPSFEVVIAGVPGAEDTRAMTRALAEHFVPNKVVVLRPDDEESPRIVDIAEYTRYQNALNGAATAYVCRNYACDAPTTEIAVMLESLNVKPE